MSRAMRWLPTTLLLLMVTSRFSALTGAVSSGEPSAAERLFALRVRPVILDRCGPCHGADPAQVKGGLRVLSREELLRGGESGRRVLVPNEPEASALYHAVTRRDADSAMPPKESDRLTDAQVAAIGEWIAQGAPWPTDDRIAGILEREAEGVVVTTSGGLSPEWDRRRYREENLWAYRPLRRPMVPTRLAGAGVMRSEIDAFVEARLASVGGEAGPRADRRTLLRRVSFDLTGLPPTPEEMAAFESDPAGDSEAFDRVVERLLASPHYGEHWARHWLDVARYADSSGLANDYERGPAWRYRDYVVRAFNADKPYDRFIIEQVAGDELYDLESVGARDPEWLLAAGFLRMGPWELTSMEVPKVARQRFLDDMTDSIGQVFLGHTLQCARCHDHKFDPVPTRDYYSMQAALAATQPAEREAPFVGGENTAGFEERRFLEARQAGFRRELNRLELREEAAGRAWASQRGLPYVPRGRGLQEGIPEDRLAPKGVGFRVEDFGIERISRKGLERIRWQLDRYEPTAFSVYSGATPKLAAVTQPLRLPADRGKGDMERTTILAGGDPFSPSQPVTPAVLSVVGAFVPNLRCEFPAGPFGRRLALARWVASAENPLTARAMVNRIWQWHFSKPLAANPNNFGATGGKPSHPELLDWLACEFVARGWSVKSMHRLILRSDAYCRTPHLPVGMKVEIREVSRAGFGVFPSRRLSAEELRDSVLAVSGELNREVGGIPNRPEIHLDAALQPRMVMGTFAEAWQPNPLPSQRHRRSVYALKIRGLGDPFMEVFNQPSPDASCEARDSSLVTPQVFSLFNSGIAMDRAVAFAVRLQREAPVGGAAIRRAFQLAYGREPEPMELAQCLEHWRAMTLRHRAISVAASAKPAEVVREAVEENTGARFRYVEELAVHREFVPDIQFSDVDPETRGLAEVCHVLFNSGEFAFVY